MTERFTYRTIQAASSSEYKDRGSKFLAFAFPVRDEQEVKEQLKEVKSLHSKAVHHCYAYRLGLDGNSYRANDDGEPSGSAGKPILGQIDSAGVTNVFVVVVRYFGGMLLGVPGLINAYKTVTADVLAGAEKMERWVEAKVDILFDYAGMSEVLYLLKKAEATIYKQELQLFCSITAGIPLKYLDSYLPRLSEIRGVTVRPVKPL